MAVALKDVREWSEYGRMILASKEKLDVVVNNRYYSKDFECVYYAIAKSPVDFKAVERSLAALNKRAMGLNSREPLKEAVREFIADSKLLYTHADVDEFRRLLKSNGLMPVDPEEEMRKAREAAERERRIKEAATRRTMRIVFTFAAAASIAAGLFFGIPYYRYHHVEYRMLMLDAENYIEQAKYDDAVRALGDARDRASGRKKIDAINERITEVRNMKAAEIKRLKQEIETILNTFKTASFKYGRPENDFETTQGKINRLKSLSDDAAYKKYQRDLDYIRNRKI